MTNYRAILQYHYRGNTTTQIAKLCECSRTTVLKTIKRAKECGIDEPAFELLSDIQLLEKLYPKRVHRTGYEEPDFIALEKDKKKRHSKKPQGRIELPTFRLLSECSTD